MVVEKFKSSLQYVVPHHLLSRLVAKLAECQIPWIKNSLIKTFIHFYKIDLNTAMSSKLSEYPSFNDFFTRSLKAQARPIADGHDAIVSPADGYVSQAGNIRDGNLFQAKDHSYNLVELLGGDVGLAKKYYQGQFITIYLAPHNYHRVHMPLAGKLLKTIYVPGQLFSVNNRSVQHIPNLFCRNERLICFFESEVGEIALIMVGAMLVAGIETVWGQREIPCSSQQIIVKDYTDEHIFLKKGEEMGRFQFGSTVILLFPPAKTVPIDIPANQPINMGALISRVISESN